MIIAKNAEVTLRGKVSELIADYCCIVASLKQALPAPDGEPDASQLIRHFTEIALLSHEERDERLDAMRKAKAEAQNRKDEVAILPLLKRIVDLLED